MKTSDNQIKISISKITNHEEQTNSVFLLISFISNKSGIVILTKNVKAICRDSQLIINTNLKIQYSQDQNIIIIKIAKIIGKSGQIILGDFILNLQKLKQKKKLLLPFGKGKGSLQIEEYSSKKRKCVKEDPQFENNYGLSIFKKPNNIQQFIKDRQQFLAKYTNRSRSNEQNSQVSKKFVEKVSDLLSQVKKVKENFSFHANDYQNYSNQAIRSNFDSQKVQNKQIRTSRSSVNLRNSQIYKSKSVKKDKQLNIKEDQSDRNSNLSKNSSNSQKYVLFVNNLNLVPAQKYIQEERLKQRQKKGNYLALNKDYY